MKQLTAIINSQLTSNAVGKAHIFKINTVNRNAYLLDSTFSADVNFGAMSAQFTLNNNSDLFSPGGSYAIEIGDIIEYTEKYADDSTEFKKFYGKVVQRSRDKQGKTRTIIINCLDYISEFQNWDINLKVEGTKVEITAETLVPTFLPSPNDTLAQLFNFANNGIATDPRPIIMIKDKVHSTYDQRNMKEYEIYGDTGQLKLGSPINAQYNYDVYAKSYWFYTIGVYVEDILEELITEPDGYGNYLFGEATAEDVIDNHLTDTFNNVTGKSIDTLTPNLSASTITVRHQVTEAVSAGDTSITLDSVEGLPNSGEGSINGDTFTWTGIGSGNTLTGVSESGSYALKAHPADSYMIYSASYARGRVWYLQFSNVQTAMDDSDFTLPSGSSIDYFDQRYGRIILDSAIDVTSTVVCNTNYTFKTLQASGIEINNISFNPRELTNRLEAIKKLFDYIAPNYIVRTIGDNRIWSGYMTQKTVADYTLKMIEGTRTLEDEDLYTRVIFYGKNENPTNIMFQDGVDFISTGESYKSLASMNTLSYDREDGDYYVFKSLLSGEGYINLEDIKPSVYMNGIPIDDSLHQMIMQPIQTVVTTRTEVKSGCHGISKESYTKIHTYYYYQVYFSHQSIEPSKPIYLYDATGVLLYTLSANDPNVNYARGIWYVSGENQNATIESISTATYWVFYSTRSLIIDYDNIEFKIHKTICPNPDKVVVQATYEYWTVFVPMHDVASVKDGRYDTQAQIEFYSEPPSGYNLAIIDLGAQYEIQTMDIISGFFMPDEYRRFDTDMRLTLQYSLDGVNYYAVSKETENFSLASGDSKTFEEKDIGLGFQTRYLKLVLEGVNKIDYKNGVWVVAITEIAIYGNIVLKSDVTLIPTTYVSVLVTPETGTYSIDVDSTEGFDSSGTAYIKNDDGSFDTFTYSSLTSTSFEGCEGLSNSHEVDDMVVQELESDDTVYDVDCLLIKLGDRIYKESMIDDNKLYSQTSLDRVGKAYLKEFIKNHNKKQVSVHYSPHLCVGDTVYLEDDALNYFVESINSRNGYLDLTLARYPA